MKKVIQLTFKLILVIILLLTTTCEDPPIITSLKIGSVTTFAETTATVSAEFIDISSNVTAYGHCWATTESPEVSDSKIINSGIPSKDEFSSNITGLSPSTEYHVRAFAMEGANVIYGSGEKSFTTLDAKYINITAPVASEKWTKGSTQNITWTDNISENVHIELFKGGTLLEDIIVSTESDETHNWPIREGLTSGTDYSIKISSVDDASISSQSETFEISEEPYITITAPTTGNDWQKGSSQTIRWDDNLDENVNIELFKGGAYDSDIAANITNDDTEDWLVPISLLAGDNYSIKISNVSDGSISDESVDFTISAIIPTVITQDAISITENSATLNGTVNANGEEVTVSFEYGETTAYGNVVDAIPLTVSGTTVTAVSADISSLALGTNYHFRLKAENSDGRTNGNDIEFTTSTTKPTATTLAASSITETTAILNGTVNANDYETTVTFEYGTTDSYGDVINFTSNPVTGSTETDVSASLTNLLAGTTYHYRVKAENSGGISYGDDEEFMTNAYYINITSPASDSLWEMAFGKQIEWTDNLTENVKIELYKSGSWSRDIDANTESNGSYTWNIPDNITDASDYQIRISNVNDGSIEALSDNFELFGTISDNEGNTYRIIKIGHQWWMKENLKTTHFNSGTSIPIVTDQTAWQSLTSISLAYCYYNNSTANGDIYGVLYTWAAANYGICPLGWHLPTDKEWQTLEYNIGMSVSDTSYTGWRGTVGKKLKESGTVHWSSPNTGDDSAGFTALPGGSRDNNGYFGGISNFAYFWTSTSYDSQNAWHRGLRDTEEIARSSYLKRFGRSVRCIKD